jgi:hypothetical protein
MTMSRDKSRDHTAMLFDYEKHVFQVNTPIKSNVMIEVRWAVILKDGTCICG